MTSELRSYVKRKSKTKRDLCFFDMEKTTAYYGRGKGVDDHKEKGEESRTKQ